VVNSDGQVDSSSGQNRLAPWILHTASDNPPPHAGLIVVEVPDTMPPAVRKRIIVRQLVTLAGQSLANTLVIIEAHRVRVRR